MPYIPASERLFILYPATTSELNYEISQLVKTYLEERGQSYQSFNDVIGVLECLKMEVYRRLVAPYEDKKMEENGDVF